MVKSANGFKIVDNKLTITKKESEYIDINANNTYIFPDKRYINLLVRLPPIKRKKYFILSNNLSTVTTCENGLQHIWTYENKTLHCHVCGIKYNNIKKVSSENLRKNSFNRYVETKYIVNDKSELIANNSSISRDKIIDFIKKNKNEISKKYNNILIEQKKYIGAINNNNKNDIKAYENIIEQYPTNINSYIDSIIQKLTFVLGSTVTFNTFNIHIVENKYIVTHDFSGKKLSNPLVFLESQISIKDFNILVYDSKNKLTMYYNLFTNIYTGFVKNNIFNSYAGDNITINVFYSVKNILKMLGSKYRYYRVTQLNEDIIRDIIRYKVINTKIIINSIIKNLYSKEDIYNKIKFFDNSESIYDNISTIKPKIDIKKLNNDKDFIDSTQLIQFNGPDAHLLYYVLNSLEHIIKNNKANIVNLFVSSLINGFYKKFDNFENLSIERYNTNYSEILDINVQVVGVYNELMNNEEVRELNESRRDQNNEDAMDILGIEDYDMDDDVDNRYEALDNFND